MGCEKITISSWSGPFFPSSLEPIYSAMICGKNNPQNDACCLSEEESIFDAFTIIFFYIYWYECSTLHAPISSDKKVTLYSIILLRVKMLSDAALFPFFFFFWEKKSYKKKKTNCNTKCQQNDFAMYLCTYHEDTHVYLILYVST